jgi:hypothetical protein
MDWGNILGDFFKYASGHPGGKVEDRLGQGCKLVYFQTKNPKFW